MFEPGSISLYLLEVFVWVFSFMVPYCTFEYFNSRRLLRKLTKLFNGLEDRLIALESFKPQRKSEITAEEFDSRFEAGEDMSNFIDWSKGVKKNA